MRKFIFSILLASAAASPALAQDQGRWHQEGEQSDRAEARQQAHEQRQEQRQEARQERTVQQPQQQQQPPQPQVEARRQQWQGGNSGGGQQGQAQQQWQGRNGSDGRRRDEAQQQVVQQQQQQQRQYDGRNRGSWNGSSNWSGRQVEQNQQSGSWSRDRGSWSRDRDGDLRQRQADQQNSWQNRNWQGSGTNSQNRNWANNWNRNWRNDSRYDWHRYRNSHRSIFRIGIYYDPFGYNYRSFDIGYRMYPAYFGQQYWIDPALYGLPYPPPGAQWVRYWNDAVLVDMYSGEVIDVIRDFFW